MKMKTFIIVLILTFSSLLANENTHVIEISQYQLGGSLGFVNGINTGFGWINSYTEKNENSINFHYHETDEPFLFAKDFISTGLYIQTLFFGNKKRKHFYYGFNAGLDYIEGYSANINIGGSNNNDNKFKKIAPLITFGLGYRIGIMRNYNLQIFWDIGIKSTITNINISIIKGEQR